MRNAFNKVSSLIFSGTAKDTSVVFLGNAASSLLGIVFTIIAARYLGPEGWGIAAAVISFISIISAIGDLGLTSGLFRFISGLWSRNKRKKAKDLQGAIFLLRVSSALVLGFLLVVFSPVISDTFFKVDNPVFLVLGAIGLFGILLIDFQVASLQSKLKWGSSAIFISLTNIFRVFLAFIFIKLNLVSITSLLLIFFGSPAISFLISLLKERPKVDLNLLNKKAVGKIASFSSWMGLNRIVGAATSRLDVLMLIQLATAYETGILAAARQLANGIPIIVGSFATVLAPRFSSYKGKNLKDFFNKSVLLSLLISGGILIGWFVAEPLISLFGDKYQDSVQVLRWFLIAMVPFALSTPAVNAIIYSFSKPKVIAILSLVQLPLVFLGNLYFIPRLGVLGPVVVVGLWNTSTLIVSYIFAISYFKKQ